MRTPRGSRAYARAALPPVHRRAQVTTGLIVLPVKIRPNGRQDHRGKGHDARGRVNPTWQRHVAAYKLAEPSSAPASCLTWAAGSGTASTCWPRGKRSESTSTPAPWKARERETVVADMRRIPRGRQFDSVLSVHSVEHVPDPEKVVAEVSRVLRPEGVAVFVTPQPAHLRQAGRDHRSVPLHRVRCGPAGGILPGRVPRGRNQRHLRHQPVHVDPRRGTRPPSTGCSAGIPCVCAAWFRPVPSSASMTSCCAACAASMTPGRADHRR